MTKDFRNELKQMERLMNYGMNESKKSTDARAIVEYKQLGADGNTYGILKEGTKYYVKVAPKKDTAILAEDFDYVGGFNRRKAFDSYTKASQELNFKLMSINEAVGNKKPIKSQYNINESAEWQTNETKEARAELNRFYQLVENVDNLLNENVHYIRENEGCKNAPFCEKPTKKNGGGNSGKIGSPDQGLGISNTEYVKGKNENADNIQKKYEKAGINQTKEHQTGTSKIDMDGGNCYTKNVKESKEDWFRDYVHDGEEGLLDRTHGTEIGDTAPWTENVNENFDTTEWDDGLPGQPGTGDAKLYKEPFINQKGVQQPVSEQYIFEVEFGAPSTDECGMGECGMSEQDFPSADEAFTQSDVSCLDELPETDDMPYEEIDNESDDEFDLNEAVLNDFGKHPAYRKKPMDLPANGGDSEWGRDWNDESTKGEQPYGSKIGSSAPYTDAIDRITNAIVCQLSKKKE